MEAAPTEAFSDRVNRERREHREAVLAFITPVVAALGPPWAINGREKRYESDDSVDLLDDAGHTLYFNFNHRKGRVEIRGGQPARSTTSDWYYSTPHNETWPSISVAINRPAGKVVGEIQRRLLPDYLRLFADGEKARADYDAFRTAERDRLAELVGASNGLLRGTTVNGQCAHMNMSAVGYGDIQVSGESVKLDLQSIPFEAAKAIIELLGKLPRK